MISKSIDRLSEFLVHRKGLLPITGGLLIALNLALQFLLPTNWLTDTNLFLHIGLLLAIVGFLLVPAL